MPMPKVINLRGTSGSGKTYIVRRVMEHYNAKTEFRHEIVEGKKRKQPIGYLYWRVEEQQNPLFVVGHYEGVCGGCDNLPYGLDYVYSLIHEQIDFGRDVIFEGLIVASDTQRCIDLKNKSELLVIGLDTSLADCNRAVDERRAEKAALTGKQPPPLKLGRDGTPKNSQAKFKALIPQRATFRRAGVDFRLLDRAGALQACLEHLGLVDKKTLQDYKIEANP